MSLTIRRAEKRDRPAVLRLFAEVFGESVDPAVWEWKYDANPFPAASVAAFDGEDAVGFFGGFGTGYRGTLFDGPGVSGVDVMTSRSARRLGHAGLYRSLGERFVEENRRLGIPFYFGFPNDRHRVIGERVLGFRTVEKAGEWSRPIGEASILAGLRRRLRRLTPSDGLSEAHDSLAEALHARPGLRTDRSRATLEWRYGRRPCAAYLLVELLDPRGRSRAFGAVRIVGEKAILADLQVLDEESGDAPDLLDAIVERARAHGATTVTLRAARASRLAARAPELGFAESSSDACLELVPVDPAFPLDPVAAGFDYRFGDHDIF